jgi:hypothetical protein
LKSSTNYRPSLLRVNSPEERGGEIMSSIMATLLRWRKHTARTNITIGTLQWRTVWAVAIPLDSAG